MTEPGEAEALAAARRHFPGCVMVGAPLRLWRQRPSATEPGVLEVVQPALGWAVVAWGDRAVPLGVVELHADGTGRALDAAGRPWLAHAIHLALAQFALPDLHAAYLAALDEAGVERAFVADFLRHELVVPLAEGAGVMPGEEFAAWLCRMPR